MRVAIEKVENPRKKMHVNPRLAAALVGSGRFRYSETPTDPTVDVPVPQAAEVLEPLPETEPTQESPTPEPESSDDFSTTVESEEGVRLTKSGKPDRRYARKDMQAEG